MSSLGPWTACSAGSSDTGLHGAHRDGMLDQHTQSAAPNENSKMMAMRAKTSPDFKLASKKDGADMKHDPKAQRDRMNMFKRQLAANRLRGSEEVARRNKAMAVQRSAQEPSSSNSFVTRSMVDKLREERLAGSGTPVTPGEGGGGGAGGGKKGGTEEADDIETHQIAAEDWPFIYFVVALDQMPVAAEDAAEFKVGKPHTAKERQRVLAARKRRIQQSREEMERVRESNIDMGLRLEPLRPASRPPVLHAPLLPGGGVRKRAAPPTRHPPTPNSSASNVDFPVTRGDYFLNHADELTIDEKMCRGFSQWFSDNFNGMQPGANKKQEGDLASGQKGGEGSGVVELPDIGGEPGRRRGPGSQPTSAPGSLNAGSYNRKVHFAEGLPFIKGSGIAAPPGKPDDQTPTDPSRPDTTPYAPRTTSEQGHVLQPPWSAPVTSRSLATMTLRSKMFKPMPIPKIDIVSEIYDELIVKTIQSFLEREGYSSERFAKLRNNVMARLSATYPHLARHRAWRLVRKDTGDGVDQGQITEAEERRLRLRPLHQGFFAAHPAFEVSEDFARDNDSFMNHIPAGTRHPNDQLRPRWVPVIPSYRPPLSREDERYASSMFMSIDGRGIPFTPRDDLERYGTSTLPGATSDFRMGPMVSQEDRSPVKAWSHIIPGTLDE